MAYITTSRAVITGQHGKGSWIMVVDLAKNQRSPFREGSQPSVQPVR